MCLKGSGSGKGRLQRRGEQCEEAEELGRAEEESGDWDPGISEDLSVFM